LDNAKLDSPVPPEYIRTFFTPVEGPVSISFQSLWDLWWRKWHWDRFSL